MHVYIVYSFNENGSFIFRVFKTAELAVANASKNEKITKMLVIDS